MDSHFAPSKRAAAEELAAEIRTVSANPVMSGLLQSVSGVLAVLDEHRQVVAHNDALLKLIGVEDPTKVLGLRPGEVVRCVHADKSPAGCGTTKWCSTCGAAVAIVTSLGTNKPVERLCALKARRGEKEVDIALQVRSQPINVGEERYLLLFLQDITLQEQRAALERTFFHDINNVLVGLVGASELLAEKDSSELVQMIHHASLRLMNEIAVQRNLSGTESSLYQPLKHTTTATQIMTDIQSFFENHPVSNGKKMEPLKTLASDVEFTTDVSLLSRVLGNMVVNAFEATPSGGAIRFWAEQEEGHLCFCVWNSTGIPGDVAQRVFQRNFSTKTGPGRGFGTYSMRYFGETVLGGKVDFASSVEDGTVFRLRLPIC